MSRIKSNLHTHTVFSDGIATSEEQVLGAIKLGFTSLGFSEHAYNSYDLDCRVEEKDIPLYRGEIARLREKYAKQIAIYIGIENDYYEPMPHQDFDFVIGSVHYLKDENNVYHSIDHLPGMFEQAVRSVGQGSVERMIETYYALVINTALKQRPDIIGHMDLVTKLNTGGRFFDEQSSWYKEIMTRTANEIAKSNCIVEINTGGMYRGYSLQPYPSIEFIKLLREREVPVTISSDAHCVEALDYMFDEIADILLSIGFTCTRQLVDAAFVDVPIR